MRWSCCLSLLIMIHANSVAADMDTVNLVNNYVNDTIEFETDLDNWGVKDYWTSPVELFAKGSGDCEDYAIAKYFMLLQRGVDPDKLKLWYTRSNVGAHMILAYDPDPKSGKYDPMILDSYMNHIRLLSERPDLTIIFSFNKDTTDIKIWNSVLEKARAEGYIKEMSHE